MRPVDVAESRDISPRWSWPHRPLPCDDQCETAAIGNLVVSAPQMANSRAVQYQSVQKSPHLCPHEAVLPQLSDQRAPITVESLSDQFLGDSHAVTL
jgi:hypothetical protein